MIVCNLLQMKNTDLPLNLKLDQSDINFSTKMRNLDVVFDEILILKYQVAAHAVKKEGYWRSYKYYKNIKVCRHRI